MKSWTAKPFVTVRSSHQCYACSNLHNDNNNEGDFCSVHLPHKVGTQAFSKEANRRGYLFASDIKMCIGISLGNVPLIQFINK